jgi:glucuronoarabinoxylan endo-1,4-beta-xylanase
MDWSGYKSTPFDSNTFAVQANKTYLVIFAGAAWGDGETTTLTTKAGGVLTWAPVVQLYSGVSSKFTHHAYVASSGASTNAAEAVHIDKTGTNAYVWASVRVYELDGTLGATASAVSLSANNHPVLSITPQAAGSLIFTSVVADVTGYGVPAAFTSLYNSSGSAQTLDYKKTALTADTSSVTVTPTPSGSAPNNWTILAVEFKATGGGGTNHPLAGNILGTGTLSGSLSGGTAGGMSVNLATTYQTMDGFGAADIDYRPFALSSAQRTLLWDPVNGIGLSIYRALIDSDGLPRRDPTDYANEGPWDLWAEMKAAVAINPSLRVVASPWTPPAASKDNGLLQGGHLLPAQYASWASTLAGFVTTAKAQSPSIPIFAVGAQNEPDLGTNSHSCLYSATEMRDFVKVLGPALAALSPAPKLLAPELVDWLTLGSYVSTIEGDATAAANTHYYAVHQYSRENAAAPTSSARPYWMTEMSGLAGGTQATWDPSIVNGIATAKWIHAAITTGNVSAWIWWWFMAPGNSGTPPTMSDNEALIVLGSDNTNYTITKRLYTLGNYSKFVRPGAIRVDASGAPAGVSVTAYKDNNSQPVIVAINENAGNTALTVNLSGATSTQVTPYVTSAADNLVAKAPVTVTGGAFSFTLPGSSVTTFVGSGGGTTHPLSGNISGTGTLAGGLAVAKTLAGGVAGLGTLAGGVAVSKALAGNVSGLGTLAGAVAVSKALAGGIAGLGSLTGDLAVSSASTVPLAGAIAGTGVFAGALSLNNAIAGNVQGIGTLAGSLSITNPLAGGITGTGMLTASIVLNSRLAGDISGTGTFTGILNTFGPVPLAGNITMATLMTGYLIVTHAGGQPAKKKPGQPYWLRLHRDRRFGGG